VFISFGTSGHADAAGEQVGHQAGFQYAEFTLFGSRNFDLRVEGFEPFYNCLLLVWLWSGDQKRFHLPDVEVLLRESTLDAENLVLAKG
jgi:hypothetical protein